MTIEATADWLVGEGRSPKTVANYVRALSQAERWLLAHGLALDTLNARSAAAYADTLPHTRSSRALLRSALAAHWSASGRLDGPVRAIRVPKHPTMRCRALEDPTAARLAAAAAARRDRKGAAVLLGLYAGLRRAEIADLRWCDIGSDGWLTIVGKGDVTRVIPLHPAVRGALAALDAPPSGVRGRQGSRARVFVGSGGGPLNPTTVWTWVRAVAADAGLPPVPTHVLRHTALATALDHTGDLRAVQELAGHARPETTAGYTRVRRHRLEAAVAAISFDVAI